LQSTAVVGDTFNVGLSAASLIQPGVTLSNGIQITDFKAGGVKIAGKFELLQQSGNRLAIQTDKAMYYADALASDQALTGGESADLVFKSADSAELCTITIKNTTGLDILNTDVAQSLVGSRTHSLELSGLGITAVNFGSGVSPGGQYRIAKPADSEMAPPDSLELEQLSGDGEWIPTNFYAFAGNALESGASETLAFTNAQGKTLMTVDLKNPTTSRIESKSGSDGLPGIQDLLVTGFGVDGDKGPAFEAKLSAVRRPQAVRYIYEVDPTTGAMLNSLDQPTAKIFASLPNGAPDRTVNANGVIAGLSPSFKYGVRIGADAESTVEGVPFGGTNPTLDFEISQWEGTSVESANAQTKSLQVGGRSLSRLTGLTIDPGGRLVASYSNGDVIYGGRLALATVPAQGGLIPVGSNLFQESYFSGQTTIGNPGDPGLGTIRSETVEDSNLDLAQELIRLTQLQRVYQANAKTISSADELMKTLLQV
jgi:flagellar hook protein FlgE